MFEMNWKARNAGNCHLLMRKHYYLACWTIYNHVLFFRRRFPMPIRRQCKFSFDCDSSSCVVSSDSHKIFGNIRVPELVMPLYKLCVVINYNFTRNNISSNGGRRWLCRSDVASCYYGNQYLLRSSITHRHATARAIISVIGEYSCREEQ